MKDVLSLFDSPEALSVLMSVFFSLTFLFITVFTVIKRNHEERYLRTLRHFEFLKEHTKNLDEKEEQEAQKNVMKQEQEVKSHERSYERPYEKPYKKLHEKPYDRTLGIYQQQATNHSNLQFYVGLIMSIVGFILLIGIIIFAVGSDNTVSSAISVVGSLIFEGISLMFLKESQKLRIRVKEYHDSVLENSNRKESIDLADKIQDEKLRSLVQAQLAFHLMGIDPSTLNISNLSDNNSSLTEDDSN
ncbi:TRADD-N-associated membrane domain-containing protein [Bacillus halotolerans]